METNKNMDTGKLTVIQLGRIVSLMHTDMKNSFKRGVNFGIQQEEAHWEADSHTIRSDCEANAHENIASKEVLSLESNKNMDTGNSYN